ncbi:MULTISPECIES: phosphonate C-P lyase system protein PhnG [Rhodomicrobium]|uniref:phosphonate C-P lyase system protein PhnG n=1 Tax=Rhodomicrobium TaxID=1068 RepID=UPI001FDA96D6|nr:MULTISPECIES: phosphonate C-P lyase system protein PhnG [Rhodomicrobium]
MTSPVGDHADARLRQRQVLMRICAEATEAELERAFADCGGVPDAEDVRAPEAGLVMLRGRIGGDGGPFNVGEATVTRAVVRLPDGALGYSYLLGRSARRARLAAIVDALGQDAGWRERLDAVLVAPVTARREAELAERREQAAATRVNFFTLVRGED